MSDWASSSNFRVGPAMLVPTQPGSESAGYITVSWRCLLFVEGFATSKVLSQAVLHLLSWPDEEGRNWRGGHGDPERSWNGLAWVIRYWEEVSGPGARLWDSGSLFCWKQASWGEEQREWMEGRKQLQSMRRESQAFLVTTLSWSIPWKSQRCLPPFPPFKSPSSGAHACSPSSHPWLQPLGLHIRLTECICLSLAPGPPGFLLGLLSPLPSPSRWLLLELS